MLLLVAFIGFGYSVATQRTVIQFFPDNKPNQIIVYIEYPQGTDIEKTNTITKEIESQVYTILNSKENMDGDYNYLIESVVSQVGEGA
jgi:multidrug efflux pump subunit AcrB